MASYVERVIKKCLESRYDIVEHTVGNYKATMKYDGYSAMIDIYYLDAKEWCGIKEICSWDSLDKRIKIADEDQLTSKCRERINKVIEAIKNLGYEINEVLVYCYDEEKGARDKDIAYEFKQLSLEVA